MLANIQVACILGTPFFVAVEPHGSTKLPDQKSGYFISIPSASKDSKIKVKLPFVSTPRPSSMVYTIQSKTLKIEELKSKQSALRISDQLSQSHIQQKIQMFRQEIEEQICSENPTAFWHQKKHEVMLPYKDDYKGKPCKSRAIPMNVEYQKLCSEEIKNLLSKGLIRESISPWNCYGF